MFIKRSNTTFFHLVITWLLVFSLGSCSQPIPQPTYVDGGSEKIIITFAVPSTSNSNYKSIIEAFHEHNPNISVRLVNPASGLAAWNSQDLEELASAADVILLYSNKSQLNNNRNYFLDLSPFIDADSTFQSNDFWPNGLTACQDAESRYRGIPISLGFTGIFYDPKAFDAVGLPYPIPGWTWENFRNAISSITNRDGDQTLYAFVDQTNLSNSILAPIIDENITENNGQIDVPSMVDSIQWYFEFVRSENLYPFQNRSNHSSLNDSWIELFGQNYPPMWIGQIDTTLPSGVLAIDRYSIVPFPVSSDEPLSKTSPVWAKCALISAGTQHPREAWTWLNFLTWHLPDSDQSFPSRQPMINSSESWGKESNNSQASIRFGLEHAWYGSQFSNYYESLTEALIPVMEGKVDLVHALETIQVLPLLTPSNSSVVVAPLPSHLVNQEDIVVINYLAPDAPGNETMFQELVKEFQQEHPEIVVQVAYTLRGRPNSGQSYLDAVTTKYDCFTNGTLVESESLDTLLDLEPLLTTKDSSFRSDFYPNQLEAFTRDGHVFALPASFQPTVMYYNKDLLTQNGIQIPSIDWSFEDFLQLISQPYTKEGSDQIYGFAGGIWIVFEGLNPVRENLWMDPSSISLDSSESISAGIRLNELVKTGAIYPGWETEKIARAITSGKVVFWKDKADSTVSADSSFSEINMDFVPFPRIPGHKWVIGNYSLGQFISKKSEHTEACWMWIKYLSGKPHAFPGVPATRSMANSPAWEASVGVEKARILRAAMEDSIPVKFLSDPTLDPVLGFQSMALGEITSGKDPTLVLVEAQLLLDLYFQCMDKSIITPNQGAELKEQVNMCYQEAYQQFKTP